MHLPDDNDMRRPKQGPESGAESSRASRSSRQSRDSMIPSALARRGQLAYPVRIAEIGRAMPGLRGSPGGRTAGMRARDETEREAADHPGFRQYEQASSADRTLRLAVVR